MNAAEIAVAVALTLGITSLILSASVALAGSSPVVTTAALLLGLVSSLISGTGVVISMLK